MNDCTRSHIVVTGASSGIGRATALYLAGAGQHVYAGVRKPADGSALRRAAAGEITPVLLDVTDAGQIAAAADAVSAHVGDAGLVGLVNNAGFGLFGPLELVPLEQFRNQLEVNVTGQLAVTRAFLPLLRRARGRVIVMGSIGTRFTLPFAGPLDASKSAITAMAASLRQELAPWDVRVVVIEPASIRTEAVDKLGRDAERLMTQSDPLGRSLYEDAFRRLVRVAVAREQNGSAPGVVAKAVGRALTARRPRARYLVGKYSRRIAVIALMPTPVLDALRRKIAHQPARRSRVAEAAPAPPAASAASAEAAAGRT